MEGGEMKVEYREGEIGMEIGGEDGESGRDHDD